jgi:uncharacterized repeat protein (TIGR03803 family)
MKTRINIPAVLPGLIAGLGLLVPDRLTAQTFTSLHNFAEAKYNGSNTTNSDGSLPARLLLSGNILYGTAGSGSTNGNGTLFAINTDGTDFTNLRVFPAEATNALGQYTNSDGANPSSGLVLAGTTLYGAAHAGGTNGTGTVFAINTNGTGFTVLHTFSAEAINSLRVDTNSEGIGPNGLILSGNTLYGTASQGGANGNGTLFAINTNGSGFTNLYTFSAKTANALGDLTNSDGASPSTRLTLAGTTLYGAAQNGGTNGSGTVFAVSTNGAGFTTLHSFALAAASPTLETNSDGASPSGSLVLSGNTLYGTATLDGINGAGTVFALSTNGTAFSVLHTFAISLYLVGEFTNSDGINPNGSLVLSGNTLYGSADYGGTNGEGTVFALSTNGAALIIHAFTVLAGSPSTNSDGASPVAGLVLSGNTLYGTTSAGGRNGAGTVFSLSFAPQLAIAPAGINVVLAWPTNVTGFDYTGFTLQSTTNLNSPVSWDTVSQAQDVADGQEVVTDSISGPEKFYRLNQ